MDLVGYSVIKKVVKELNCSDSNEDRRNTIKKLLELQDETTRYE